MGGAASQKGLMQSERRCTLREAVGKGGDGSAVGKG